MSFHLSLLLLIWLFCSWTLTAQEPELSGSGLVFPLQLKVGGTRARGLLKNATLPLHGAVKDYG